MIRNLKATETPWYVGVMNDCAFIINKPPRPSNDEVWHDRPDGPEVICKMGPTELDTANAALIVLAVNERDALKAELADMTAGIESAKRLSLAVNDALRDENSSLRREAAKLKSSRDREKKALFDALAAIQWWGDHGCPWCDRTELHASDCKVGRALLPPPRQSGEESRP
jgi:hypothetical protein